VNFQDTRNPSGGSQDLSVRFRDAGGGSQTLRVGASSAALFFPPGAQSAVPKVLQNTVRLPLGALTAVDRTRISEVAFLFDQRASGALLLSDLHFYRRAGGAPPTPTVVFADDFEADRGWTRNPDGTDTATTGLWERGDPEPTSSGTALQNGTTVSGVNDLVTARLAGASAGANDVDGGVTSIRSPLIDLPSGADLTLSFGWYLATLNNATADDFFRVSIVTSAGRAQVFQQLGSAVARPGNFATATVSLNAFAGQSVRILIEAADNGTGSLIEAAVDDVRITKN
jgi:hypothetical protein